MHTIPVMITTIQALICALEDQPTLLHIDYSLLYSSQEHTQTLLSEHPYRLYGQGKHGLFYLRRDVEKVSIYDPMGIY